MIVPHYVVVGFWRRAIFSLDRSCYGDINGGSLNTIDHGASIGRCLAFTILGYELLIFLFIELFIFEWLP